VTAQAPAPAPPKTGFPFRRAAFAVCALAIAVAGFLRIGTIAWALGGAAFLLIAFSYFQFHRPSRWRLAAASGRWWATPILLVLTVLSCFAFSGVFHSAGLLASAVFSRLR
jgi:hypothetical protein